LIPEVSRVPALLRYPELSQVPEVLIRILEVLIRIPEFFPLRVWRRVFLFGVVFEFLEVAQLLVGFFLVVVVYLL